MYSGSFLIAKAIPFRNCRPLEREMVENVAIKGTERLRCKEFPWVGRSDASKVWYCRVNAFSRKLEVVSSLSLSLRKFIRRVACSNNGVLNDIRDEKYPLAETYEKGLCQRVLQRYARGRRSITIHLLVSQICSCASTAHISMTIKCVQLSTMEWVQAISCHSKDAVDVVKFSKGRKCASCETSTGMASVDFTSLFSTPCMSSY